MRLGAGSSHSWHTLRQTPSRRTGCCGCDDSAAPSLYRELQGSASCEGFGAVLVKKLCVLTLQTHLSALKERCLSFQGDYFEILRGKVQAEDESCVHLSDVS